MNKKKYLDLFLPVKKFILTFPEFLKFFAAYLRGRFIVFSVIFEKNKNILVKLFMIKRGRYNRPFLHFFAMGILTIGVIIAPFLATTYPIFSQNIIAAAKFPSSSAEQSISVDENVFKTDISQKPRDKIITYTVQKGDSIFTISQKFGISQDTIRWANDLSNDSITIDDSLQILPVTGISYKVESDDTVYTIAKKFDTNAQGIVDFPFNDFANSETFSLIAGQMLIVPNGIKQSDQPFTKQQVYITYGSQTVSSLGFSWPVRGTLTQFFSWYHQAIDIAAPFGTPIYASTNGKVIEVSTGGWDSGYGNTVVVDNGSGYETRYSHLSTVSVSPGELVEGGKTLVGNIGLTGKTTGPHLDFTVINNGTRINPLSVLQ